MKIKLIDVELTQPIEPLTELEDYDEVRLLVKLHGLPVGYTGFLPVSARIDPEIILDKIVAALGWPCLTHLLEDGLLTNSTGRPLDREFSPELFRSKMSDGAGLQKLLAEHHGNHQAEPPCLQWRRRKANWFVTVAVCTRDGAERVGACLDALDALDYPDYEILIIDNAPKNDAIWKLLEQRGAARYRYVVEPRPGVSWARNRAIREARGDIIAFTDDDARPDRLWLLSLVAALQRPGVSLVTGRAYPLELENEVQLHCDRFWGHDRGFERRQYGLRFSGFPRHPYNANSYGGAYNLAAWREVFEKIGGYDTALGRGTLAGSASDTDLFYRLLRQGYIIAYEPTALVRVVYPSDVKYLVRHVYLGASGIYAYLTKCFLTEPGHRWPLLRYAVANFFVWYLWPFVQQILFYRKPSGRLLLSSLVGALTGPRNYRRSVKEAQKLAALFQSTKLQPDP